VYDVTKDKTFDSLNKWIEDLKEQANEDIVIFLVGNKLDLVEKNP
jgi:GTPase SAR1 family protein